MYNDFLNGTIEIKEMNELEFTQLITEWKQALFKIGHTNINTYVRGLLIEHSNDITDENELKIVTGYLRSE